MGLLGGLLGSDGGAGQAAAAAEANKVQKEIYDQTRSDLSGYRDIGQQGLKDLSANMNKHTGTFGASDFQKDPGFDFRMKQGQQALERSASARGGLMGGGTLKALTRYGQDYGSNEYGKARDRFNQDRDQRYGKMRDLAGIGQSAAGQSGQAGQAYANAYGQNVRGAADARAAASAAEGGALMGLIGQGIGAYATGGASLGGDTTKLMAGGGGAQPGMFRMSDIRAKNNVIQLAVSKFKDVPTYAFNYKDEKHGKGRQVGVMAQDLLALDPNHPAVKEFNGYYMVNYSKLECA